jgi:hypothetical protein
MAFSSRYEFINERNFKSSDGATEASRDRRKYLTSQIALKFAPRLKILLSSKDISNSLDNNCIFKY